MGGTYDRRLRYPMDGKLPISDLRSSKPCRQFDPQLAGQPDARISESCLPDQRSATRGAVSFVGEIRAEHGERPAIVSWTERSSGPQQSVCLLIVDRRKDLELLSGAVAVVPVQLEGPGAEPQFVSRGAGERMARRTLEPA